MKWRWDGEKRSLDGEGSRKATALRKDKDSKRQNKAKVDERIR